MINEPGRGYLLKENSGKWKSVGNMSNQKEKNVNGHVVSVID